MRYVFVMTGSVVESATPLSEPLYKPLPEVGKPAPEAAEAPKAKKAPARRATAKKAATKEA